MQESTWQRLAALAADVRAEEPTGSTDELVTAVEELLSEREIVSA